MTEPEKTKAHETLIQEAIEAAQAAEQAVSKASVEAAVLATVTKAKTAIEQAGKTRVLVSLSVKQKPRVDSSLWTNIVQNAIAFVICVIAGTLVYNDRSIEHGHPFIQRVIQYCIAFVPIGLVIVFLLVLLTAVVRRGSSVEEEFPWCIPDKGPAVFLLALLYITLVLSFAHLNLASHLTTGVRESLYKALMTVAALDHEHYKSLGGPVD